MSAATERQLEVREGELRRIRERRNQPTRFFVKIDVPDQLQEYTFAFGCDQQLQVRRVRRHHINTTLQRLGEERRLDFDRADLRRVRTMGGTVVFLPFGPFDVGGQAIFGWTAGVQTRSLTRIYRYTFR